MNAYDGRRELYFRSFFCCVQMNVVIVFVLSYILHASAGALIHRQQTIIFTQTKLSSIYRHKLIVPYWVLRKHQALLTIEAKFNIAIFIFILFFFYFSVATDSCEILASVWQEEGNFDVLKRCHIQVYPTNFLLCYGKAVNLQHM